MTVIESLKQLIKTCPCLSEFVTSIGGNDVPGNPAGYQIETITNQPVVRKYINGSSLRQCAFQFISTESYESAVIQKIESSGFYEHFSNWLEQQTILGNLPALETGQFAIALYCTSTGYTETTADNKLKYKIECNFTYYQGGIEHV